MDGEEKNRCPPSLRDLTWRTLPTGVRVGATGTGPPLLLLPGLGADPLVWAPWVPRLRRTFRLLLPVPPVPPPGAALAAVTGPLLPLLAKAPVFCLGASYGGLVGLGLALAAPEGIRRLALAGALPRFARPAWLRAALAGLRADPGAFARRMVADTVGSRFRTARPATVRALTESYRRSVAAGERALREGELSLRTDLWPHLQAVRVPVLLLVGGEDPLVPLPLARRMAAALPRAELRVFPGVGHLVLLEAREEIFPAVRRFFLADPPPRR